MKKLLDRVRSRNEGTYLNKPAVSFIKFLPWTHKVMHKGVSGMKHFYWVQSVCLPSHVREMYSKASNSSRTFMYDNYGSSVSHFQTNEKNQSA